MPSFFAFLHHVASFALVAALVLEFVLIRDELTRRAIESICGDKHTDRAVGM